MKRAKACQESMVAGALLLGLAACGSDSPGTCGAGFTGVPPNCVAIVPPPPPCTQTQVRTDQGGVPSGTLLFFDFPVNDAGRLDLTLDWTFPASNMGLYLVPAGTCSLAEFNARTCNFLIRSEPPGAKPRKASTGSLSAGNYRYLVANFGKDQESAVLQIVLSKGTCPAAFGSRYAAEATEDGAPLLASRSIDWR